MDLSTALQTPSLLLSRPVIDLFRDAVVITDHQGLILEVNQTYLDITGYTEQELYGERPAKIQSGHHSKSFYQALWHDLTHKGVWEGEIWDRRKNGEAFPKWLKIQAIRAPQDGSITHYIGVFYETQSTHPDLDERDRIANIDPLTGLYNRRSYRESLTRAIRLHPEGSQIVQLFIDIDCFKLMNERYSYVVGDDLLAAFAKRLQQAWHACSLELGALLPYQERLLARFSGDEFAFACCLPATYALDTEQFMMQLSARLSEPYVVRGHTIKISTSIGMSRFTQDAHCEEELIAHAESAMYIAKQNGGDCSVLFTQSIQEQLVRRKQIEESLLEAIRDNQFELYYQPKVGGLSRQVCGYEALVRWRHPQLGLLSPIEFITIAEETGAILPLGDWVLEQACLYAKQINDMGLTNLPVSVNVSAAQMADPSWLDRLLMVLEQTQLPHHLIELELTESQLLKDIENSTDIIHYIRSLGIKVALDDFGTGYSSLSYLRNIPLDTLKIDRSFVAQIQEGNNDYDMAVIKAVSMLAKQLGMHLVAEGVEQLDQEKILAEIGCDQLQGYLYSKPVPADEFLALCLDNLKLDIRSET
ncbi:putative bifunctional diguanylate cyclase/phosphodiesterase [Marinomonas ostreistagni]|uniref:putative bifunctional diguanylate cyclase/phosphodiesterase n=1 Tax=Marinomonas ostreistagni TaxID=359209 RepID=UPI00194E12EA|nr:GGDEF domain-containing phosphodiesterase [Marinomonas ostreistagni]MBM6552092.1 EAL domain-containing protein [Marinomonas ostreistagni]